jgi:splicing factor 3A subunit 1
MEGGAASDLPPAKRQRIAKLPGGALYPEEDWLNMHPVSNRSVSLAMAPVF